MLTGGVDLAAQPARTAGCVLEWDDAGGAVVRSLAQPMDDDAVVALVGECEKTGIDAPFGWPEPFVAAVAAHERGEAWPGRAREDAEDYRRELSLRATDRYVIDRCGQRPLSVSTDKIGVVAMRCALILDGLEDADRTGTGLVAETYPAAALKGWGLAPAGYKRTSGTAARRELVGALLERVPRLDVGALRPDLEASDDKLDALVCALIARAVAQGRTEPPPEHLLRRARTEGWIHLPAGPDPPGA